RVRRSRAHPQALGGSHAEPALARDARLGRALRSRCCARARESRPFAVKSVLGSALILAVGGCSTMGSVWVNQPLPGDDRDENGARLPPNETGEAPAGPAKAQTRPSSLGATEATPPGPAASAVQPTTLSDVPEPKAPGKPTREQLAGKVLGKFRNT